jgi:hypothetical protein
MSDSDKYIETQLGGGGVIIEFVNPPQPPQYKTRGLSRTEYIELFTPKEQALYFRFMDNIYGDLSFMPIGTVSLSDVATALGSTLTYMELMIIGKSSFVLAPAENGFDMTSPKVIGGLTAMNMLGMLDDNTRLTTILKGKLQ